jgi:hypothetical protein
MEHDVFDVALDLRANSVVLARLRKNQASQSQQWLQELGDDGGEDLRSIIKPFRVNQPVLVIGGRERAGNPSIPSFGWFRWSA